MTLYAPTMKATFEGIPRTLNQYDDVCSARIPGLLSDFRPGANIFAGDDDDSSVSYLTFPWALSDGAIEGKVAR